MDEPGWLVCQAFLLGGEATGLVGEPNWLSDEWRRVTLECFRLNDEPIRIMHECLPAKGIAPLLSGERIPLDAERSRLSGDPARFTRGSYPPITLRAARIPCPESQPVSG